MKTTAPKRKPYWFVISVNCGCAGYLWARSPFYGRNPRCRMCGRTLGFMEFKIEWSGTAATYDEAVAKAKAKMELAR